MPTTDFAFMILTFNSRITYPSRLWISLILALCCSRLWGIPLLNADTDSLLTKSDQLLDAYDFEPALEVLNLAIAGFDAHTDSLTIRSVYANMGYTLYYLGKYTESIGFYEKVLAIDLNKGDLKKAIHSYKNIGLSYRQLDLLAPAIEAYNQGLILAKETDDQEGMAELFNSMGIVYQQTGEPDKALEYHQNALNHWMQLGDSIRMSTSYNNLAICLEDQNLLDSSLYYHFKSFEIKRQKNTNPSSLAGSVNNIGYLYLQKGEPEKAFPFIWEGYSLHLSLKEPLGLAISYNNLSDYYLRKENYSMAKTYLDSSIYLNNQLKSQNIKSHNLELNIKLLEAMGNYEQALQEYKTLDTLKEEIFQAEHIEVIKLGNFYEMRQKEAENKQLMQEAELGKLQGQLYFRTTISLGMVGLALLVALFIYQRNLRIQRKLSKEIQEKNEMIQLQKQELRHRTTNFLARIHALINEATGKVKDPESQLELVRSGKILLTAASLERYLVNIEDESEVPFVNFTKGLLEQHRKIIKLEGENIQLELHARIEELYLPVQKVINCAFIISEIINNSVKHAFSGILHPTIQIHIHKTGTALEIKINDNGNGHNGFVKTGIGTSLLEKFTKDLRGQLKLDTKSGTSYALSFPINPN